MISIHASAKEATAFVCAFNISAIISIHASAKEATWETGCQWPGNDNFNPRLREGGDKKKIILLRFFQIFQSTPPRRRRLVVRILYMRVSNFNPRLREGGDVQGCTFFCGGVSISIHASAKEATHM